MKRHKIEYCVRPQVVVDNRGSRIYDGDVLIYDPPRYEDNAEPEIDMRGRRCKIYDVQDWTQYVHFKVTLFPNEDEDVKALFRGVWFPSQYFRIAD